jgi:hypothetical protein
MTAPVVAVVVPATARVDGTVGCVVVAVGTVVLRLVGPDVVPVART